MHFQSDHEALNLHAEVIAMQLQWGLSYKDVAHCLYLAELEKMRGSKQAENLMISVHQQIDRIITHDINPIINYIDYEPGQWRVSIFLTCKINNPISSVN